MSSKVTFDSVNLEDKIPQFTQEVTQEKIWKYAVASLDFNPVHIDPDWVRTAQPFGIPVTVAHGMMTISYVTTAVTNWAHPSGGWLKKIDIKLVKPAPPGTIETAGGTVTEKHPRGKSQGYVVLEVWADNQKGEKLAVGTCEVVLPDK
jgi:3-hydroxybutyryl-CoA dehydratase